MIHFMLIEATAAKVNMSEQSPVLRLNNIDNKMVQCNKNTATQSLLHQIQGQMA